MCNLAVAVVMVASWGGPITCLWSGLAEVSSPGCVCGKRLFQTHMSWSWWHRLEPLWSAWGRNLTEKILVKSSHIHTYSFISYCSFRQTGDRYTLDKYTPAKSPRKPSCATIFFMMLKVEEETGPDTEGTGSNQLQCQWEVYIQSSC